MEMGVIYLTASCVIAQRKEAGKEKLTKFIAVQVYIWKDVEPAYWLFFLRGGM